MVYGEFVIGRRAHSTAKYNDIMVKRKKKIKSMLLLIVKNTIYYALVLYAKNILGGNRMAVMYDVRSYYDNVVMYGA